MEGKARSAGRVEKYLMRRLEVGGSGSLGWCKMWGRCIHSQMPRRGDGVQTPFTMEACKEATRRP